MLERFQSIQEFLPLLEISEINDVFSLRKENQEIENLCSIMKDLNEVKLRFQRDYVTISEV